MDASKFFDANESHISEEWAEMKVDLAVDFGHGTKNWLYTCQRYKNIKKADMALGTNGP